MERNYTTDFDHTDPSFGDRLYETIDLLLEQCPVARGTAHGGFVVASRWQDVRDIFRDYETYSSANGITLPAFGNPPSKPLECDPPESQAYRNMLLPHFNPGAVATYEPMIRGIAEELVGHMSERATCDLATEYTIPLPALVTCWLLDLPQDNWRSLVDWFIRCFQHQDEEALISFMRLLRDEIEDRRGGTGPDLLTVVANAEVEGERLDLDTATSTGLLLCAAGLDTTANALGQILRLIADDESLRSAVAEDSDSLNRAIEEALRLYPPLHGVSRTTTRDLELEGVELQEGDRVALFIGAANRDPRKFDHPETFDINRRPNQHLAFGQGIHLCLGNHLARAELRIGVQTLLNAAPRFELNGFPVIEQRAFMRTVASLPARLFP